MSTSVYETFQDIYEAVINDAKESTTTAPVVTLVKRWINEGYEVVNFRKRREYLDKKYVLSMSGNVESDFTMTSGSSIAVHTGTATLLSSSLELGFQVQGFTENYEVESISSNNVILTTTYKGDSSTQATAILYQRAVILDDEISEVYDAYHDYYRSNLENLGPIRMRKLIQSNPAQYAKAGCFAIEGQQDSTEAKRLIVWPYPDVDYTLYLDTNTYADELVNGSDEPRIAPQYRQVLYWYALSKLFGTYHRNAEREQVCTANFMSWLIKLDGKEDVSQDYPRLLVDYRPIRTLRRGRAFDSRYREDPDDTL